MIAAELVDVDALWHVLLYSFAGTLGLSVAFGAVLVALDRGNRDGETAAARTSWMAVAGIAGLVCVGAARVRHLGDDPEVVAQRSTYVSLFATRRATAGSAPVAKTRKPGPVSLAFRT